MRPFVIAALAIAGVIGAASAAPLVAPVKRPAEIERIKFLTPALAPMPYTVFCQRYKDECRIQPRFRGDQVQLTEERWSDLKEINGLVNRSIIPVGERSDVWKIEPDRGDCDDYAVTKRHLLHHHGWPLAALLLSEVVTDWGEHHLVLVVRTDRGDWVLDNLTQQVNPWTRAPYQWVRTQMPNKGFWTTIANPDKRMPPSM